MSTVHRYRTSRVISTTNLSAGVYLLRFERVGLQFEPGQSISVGVAGKGRYRAYSVASGIRDDGLEILVREVTGGDVSVALHQLVPGDRVEFGEPGGFFRLQGGVSRHIFVATGTGVAPFLCFMNSFPEIDFVLAHGVREVSEAFLRERLPRERYIPCLSGEQSPNLFAGRVTRWLENEEVDLSAAYYLCGNSQMIYEARDLLLRKGLAAQRIITEVYF